jgi:hypothetical protein
MLKYIFKFLGDILPSVVATCIGAYVVNHYIIAKPDTPPAVQAAKVDDAGKVTKAAELPAVTASLPETAKSEPLKLKLGADKPSGEKIGSDKAAEKSADKPVGRHQITVHDKTATKPVSTASATPEPVKDERSEPSRDPNEVVRAAVERLRASAPAEAPRATEVAVRAPEPPRIQEPRVAAPIQALPPALTVAPATTASTAPYAAGALGSPTPLSANAVASAETRDGDARRLTPPADIPESRADLSADVGLTPARRPSVAEDVLLAAKSMFHAVLPR